MSDDEQLSRWLAGELAGRDAERLRQRLADEPELRERLAELQALLADLADLPEAMTPPPAVRIPMPNRPRAASPRGWTLAASLAAVLMAGAGGWVANELVQDDTAVMATQLELGAGTHVLQGQAIEIRTPAFAARLDGEARIHVEPTSTSARRSGQEAEMDWTHAGSAAGGAVVTVVVLSGAMWVWPGGDTAGTPERLTPQSAEQRFGEPPAVRSAGLVEADGLLASPGAEAPAEAVQQELERLRFENEMLKGQLAYDRGEPVPWPDENPSLLGPDAFEAHAESVAEVTEGVELLSVDCSEFPCMAVLTATDPKNEEGTKQAIETYAESLGAPVDGPQQGFVSVARDESDDRSRVIAILGVLPGEGSDPALHERMRTRTHSLEQDVRADMEQGEAGP